MNEALLAGVALADSDTGPEGISLGEGRMVREDCWREVHRLYHVERRSKSEIARQLELDRKTVRGILQAHAWQPYTRAERADTLLADHAAYLRSRAPAVQYSARILFQELRREGRYQGSYETVKRFVRPLRAPNRAVRWGFLVDRRASLGPTAKNPGVEAYPPVLALTGASGSGSRAGPRIPTGWSSPAELGCCRPPAERAHRRSPRGEPG